MATTVVEAGAGTAVSGHDRRQPGTPPAAAQARRRLAPGVLNESRARSGPAGAAETARDGPERLGANRATGPGAIVVLRIRNKYCSNCRATQRFLDLGATLVCEHCSKRLEVLPDAARPAGRLLAWVRPAADVVAREAC